MKKFFVFLAALVIGFSVFYFLPFTRYSSSKIDDQHIYFFGQERCPHCHAAKAYISEKYPSLNVVYKDVSIKENQADFLACADKFNLDQNHLGTPLICMGQNVILGWSETEQKRFDDFVKPFIK